MALSTSTLSAAIKAGLLANSQSQAVDNAALQALCDEVAAAVVNHITANAQVLPGTFSNSGGAVVGIGLIT